MDLASLSKLAPLSVAVVLGTRPEVVKLAGLIRLLGPGCRLIHTGQHYDESMSKVFLDEFELERPHVSLAVGGGSRARQISDALLALDGHFSESRPGVVVVQGDTNSTVAGALAANCNAIPLVHIEAGMRSYDLRMPEEHNRVVADHLATVCCAPTEGNAANLKNEGIPAHRISITGHTVIEAVAEKLPTPAARADLLGRYGLQPSAFVMSTFHRAENVDDPVGLEQILRALGKLSLPAVLPLHPRTRRRAEDYGLGSLLRSIITLAPLDYRTFLALCAESALIVTDSGGVQVEATVYPRPLVVVRDSTEYPEVVGTFATLVPPSGDIVAAAEAWLERMPEAVEELSGLSNPYGDGSASMRCLEAVVRGFGP